MVNFKLFGVGLLTHPRLKCSNSSFTEVMADVLCSWHVTHPHQIATTSSAFKGVVPLLDIELIWRIILVTPSWLWKLQEFFYSFLHLVSEFWFTVWRKKWLNINLLFICLFKEVGKDCFYKVHGSCVLVLMRFSVRFVQYLPGVA